MKIIDNEVWAVFGAGALIGIIKCIGGCNYYRLKRKTINGNGLTNQCPWYIDVKD